MACDAVGDARRAAMLHPLLASRGAYFVQVGLTATGCVGSAWHYVGLLCCAMARWGEGPPATSRRRSRMNARIGGRALRREQPVSSSRAGAARPGGARPLRLERRGSSSTGPRETGPPRLGLRLWRGGRDAGHRRAAPAGGRPAADPQGMGRGAAGRRRSRQRRDRRAPPHLEAHGRDARGPRPGQAPPRLPGRHREMGDAAELTRILPGSRGRRAPSPGGAGRVRRPAGRKIRTCTDSPPGAVTRQWPPANCRQKGLRGGTGPGGAPGTVHLARGK